MAIRNINKMTHRSHTDPLFNTCKILKISEVYEQQSNLFVYGYETNKLPMSFKNIFRHKYDIHPQMHKGEIQISILIYQEISLSKISQILLFQRCGTNI